MNSNGHRSGAKSTRGYALVDLENQTIWDGRRLPQDAAAAVLAEIDPFVHGMPTRVALAASLLTAYAPLLCARGWGIDTVAVSPDAADLALLTHGRAAIACGVTDLVIVSGDHAFIELAQHARLHVITHRDRLSRALESAATSATFLCSGKGGPLAA